MEWEKSMSVISTAEFSWCGFHFSFSEMLSDLKHDFWWFDTFSIYLIEWYWIYINFIIFLVIGSIILIISSQLLPLLFLVHCYYSCYYFNWLQLSRLDHSSSIGTKREYGSSNWRVPIHTGSALGLDIYLDICLDMSDDGRQIVAILSAVILINCSYVYFISMCLYISCIYWL